MSFKKWSQKVGSRQPPLPVVEREWASKTQYDIQVGPKRQSHFAKFRQWITPFFTDWSNGRAVLVWSFAAACFAWVLSGLLPSAVVEAAFSAVVLSLVTLGVFMLLLIKIAETMDKDHSPIPLIVVAAVGLSLVAIIGVCTFHEVYENANGPVTEEATPTKPTSDKIEAWVRTQFLVAQQLKSPSTASFGSVFSDYQSPESIVTDFGDGNYLIRAWVDSQNSFGAVIRTRFTCELEDQGGLWRCKSLVFDE